MGKKVRGAGTTLEKGKTTPIKIANLTSIDGIEVTAESIDVTTLDSADGFKEFIPGSLDGGEVSIEGFLDPTTGQGQVELQTAINAGTIDDYAIKFPADLNAKWSFKAFVTAFKAGGATTDDGLPFSATLKVTGKPTLGTLTA